MENPPLSRFEFPDPSLPGVPAAGVPPTVPTGGLSPPRPLRECDLRRGLSRRANSGRAFALRPNSVVAFPLTPSGDRAASLLLLGRKIAEKKQM